MVSDRESKIEEYFKRLVWLEKNRKERSSLAEMYQNQYDKMKDTGYKISISHFKKRKLLNEELAGNEQWKIERLIDKLPEIQRDIDIVIGELAPRVAVLRKLRDAGKVNYNEYKDYDELSSRLNRMYQMKRRIAEGRLFDDMSEPHSSNLEMLSVASKGKIDRVNKPSKLQTFEVCNDDEMGN